MRALGLWWNRYMSSKENAISSSFDLPILLSVYELERYL